MVYHTSAMVRHNADTGRFPGPNSHKLGWINRMFVSQLNAAGRHVAQTLGMPIVDWEIITRGLIPSQYLFDGEA